MKIFGSIQGKGRIGVRGMTLNTMPEQRMEDLKQRAADHFSPPVWQTNKMFSDTRLKLVSVAIGVWVVGVEGNRWFDALSVMLLVENRASKEKFPKKSALPEPATAILKDPRTLGRMSDSIPVAPHLCLTEDERDRFVNQMDCDIAKIESTL